MSLTHLRYTLTSTQSKFQISFFVIENDRFKMPQVFDAAKSLFAYNFSTKKIFKFFCIKFNVDANVFTGFELKKPDILLTWLPTRETWLEILLPFLSFGLIQWIWMTLKIIWADSCFDLENYSESCLQYAPNFDRIIVAPVLLLLLLLFSSLKFFSSHFNTCNT